MPSSDRVARYCVLLLLDWLNERFDARFELSDAAGEAMLASDGEHRAGVFVAPLWESEAAGAWQERLRALEERLDAAAVSDGPFLLWVPPRADVPVEEPGLTDFVQRVAAMTASLPRGGRTEVMFPATVKMAKVREEGGYASVMGGLSRWWTRITENVQGTYHVDGTAVHRLTRDGDAREQLWQNIGLIAQGVEVGQAAEFEIEEAWTLQRLPEQQEHGFALAGAPPSSDPTEGILVRRVARKRLQQANEALGALDVELRAVGLIGIYEYAELEGAGATVKALDPSLYARLEAVGVLADGEVRPTFLPRSLPWAG